MAFFGIIRRRRPGPVAVRRAAWIGNLVEGIGVSEEELREVRDEMTPEMKDHLPPLYAKWEEAMAPVWKDHLERIDAENAQRRTAQ